MFCDTLIISVSVISIILSYVFGFNALMESTTDGILKTGKTAILFTLRESNRDFQRMWCRRLGGEI